MWHALKSLSFSKLIDSILFVIRCFPPSFVIVVSAGLVILTALAIKRILF